MDAKRFVKHLPASAGQSVFCVVTWKQDQFDISATDANRSWTQQGIRAPPPGEHSLPPKEYMAACYDALCSRTPLRSYVYTVLISADNTIQIKLQFEWVPGVEVVITLELQPAPDHVTQLTSMMTLLCDGYTTLLAAVGDLTTANDSLAKQLAATQQELKKDKETHKNLEQDLYVKFSCLLNTKKAKLRELQQQIEEKDQQIEQLQEAATRMPEVEEDSGVESEQADVVDRSPVSPARSPKTLSEQEEEAEDIDIDRKASGQGQLSERKPSPVPTATNSRLLFTSTDNRQQQRQQQQQQQRSIQFNGSQPLDIVQPPCEPVQHQTSTKAAAPAFPSTASQLLYDMETQPADAGGGFPTASQQQPFAAGLPAGSIYDGETQPLDPEHLARFREQLQKQMTEHGGNQAPVSQSTLRESQQGVGQKPPLSLPSNGNNNGYAGLGQQQLSTSAGNMAQTAPNTNTAMDVDGEDDELDLGL